MRPAAKSLLEKFLPESIPSGSAKTDGGSEISEEKKKLFEGMNAAPRVGLLTSHAELFR